jgi:hypothetical protein
MIQYAAPSRYSINVPEYWMPRLGGYGRLWLWQGMPNRARFIVPKRRRGDVYLDLSEIGARL